MGPKITSVQAWHRVAEDERGAEETLHIHCTLLEPRTGQRGAMEAFTTTRESEPGS